MRKIIKQRVALLLMCILLVGIMLVVNKITDQTPVSENYGLNNPVQGNNRDVIYDCVWFGNYWQEDTNRDNVADENDAKQPIKWRVLSVNGDDAFLLADKVLDCGSYNEREADVTWETCTMRSWLNGYEAAVNREGRDYSSNNFLTNAFSATEQSAIRTVNVANNDNPSYGTDGGNDTLDKVYLLSLDEVMNFEYGFSLYDVADKNRGTKKTSYACSQGAGIFGDYWWLRSPGYNVYYAASVEDNGYPYSNGYYVAWSYYGVRPALHLDLSFTSSWSYAGKVNGEGKEIQTVSNPSVESLKNTNINPATKQAAGIGKISSL